MNCTRCKKEINMNSKYSEDSLINCDECGDFCSPACFNLYHDEKPHKAKNS
jgi:hypothetical protein